MVLTMAFSRPPVDEPAREWAAYVFTGVVAPVCLALVVWCVLVARREGSWLPIACLLGGFLAFGFEPVLDAVAHIHYPEGMPLAFVTVFDVTIPWYVVISYVFWMGAGTLLVVRWYERARPASGAVMRAYVLVVALSPCFEYAAVRTKALIYYGDQPFKLFGYPLYWAAVNGGGVFLAGAALVVAGPHLRGLRGFVVASLIPALSYFAFCAMTATPVWLAINSEAPMAVVWLAGLVAVGLSFAVMRVVAAVVGGGLSITFEAPGSRPRAEVV